MSGRAVITVVGFVGSFMLGLGYNRDIYYVDGYKRGYKKGNTKY